MGLAAHGNIKSSRRSIPSKQGGRRHDEEDEDEEEEEEEKKEEEARRQLIKTEQTKKETELQKQQFEPIQKIVTEFSKKVKTVENEINNISLSDFVELLKKEYTVIEPYKAELKKKYDAEMPKFTSLEKHLSDFYETNKESLDRKTLDAAYENYEIFAKNIENKEGDDYYINNYNDIVRRIRVMDKALLYIAHDVYYSSFMERLSRDIRASETKIKTLKAKILIRIQTKNNKIKDEEEKLVYYTDIYNTIIKNLEEAVKLMNEWLTLYKKYSGKHVELLKHYEAYEAQLKKINYTNGTLFYFEELNNKLQKKEIDIEVFRLFNGIWAHMFSDNKLTIENDNELDLTDEELNKLSISNLEIILKETETIVFTLITFFKEIFNKAQSVEGLTQVDTDNTVNIETLFKYWKLVLKKSNLIRDIKERKEKENKDYYQRHGELSMGGKSRKKRIYKKLRLTKKRLNKKSKRKLKTRRYYK